MTVELFPAKAKGLKSKPLWETAREIAQHSYTCGHCRNLVSNKSGFVATGTYEKGGSNYVGSVAYIHICHMCREPTYFAFDGSQFPVGVAGRNFLHVPADLVGEYVQAQKCFKAECYEATVMVARRLLMIIAWRLNAEEGKTFQEYVEYFITAGAISPAMKVWVGKIRQVGNASNHKILQVTQDEAKNVLQFLELIFDNVFEAPGAAGVASPFVLRT